MRYAGRWGVAEATFYNWNKKYGGLGVSELRRLKQLEREIRQLKKVVADLSLDKHMLQDVIGKKSSEASPEEEPGLVPLLLTDSGFFIHA